MSTTAAKFGALFALTGVSTAIGFTMKISQVQGKYKYSPLSAIAMMEVFKLLVSCVFILNLVHHQVRTNKTGFMVEARQFFRENFSWPLFRHCFGLAVAYSVVNLVTFGVMANAPASSFFLLKAASPVITALMLAGLVERPISVVQWISIISQCFGLAATQIDPCRGAPALSFYAYVFIAINIAVSCGAGVWNESVIKSYNTSVNAQNCMLYAWGVLINCALFCVVSPTVVGAAAGLSFFEGYNIAVAGVIIASGSVGLVITAVYKYADVVVKTFGLAGSTVSLFLMEAGGVIPSVSVKPLSMSGFIGSVAVFYAAYVYIVPPIVLDPEEPENRKPSVFERIRGDHRAQLLLIVDIMVVLASLSSGSSC